MSGWLINKFFPGREQIKRNMDAIFESGLLLHLKSIEFQDYRVRNPTFRRKVDDNKEEVIHPLYFDDVKGLLLILAIGHGLSFIVLILELIFIKC